jgi:hypothetical protein
MGARTDWRCWTLTAAAWLVAGAGCGSHPAAGGGSPGGGAGHTGTQAAAPCASTGAAAAPGSRVAFGTTGPWDTGNCVYDGSTLHEGWVVDVATDEAQNRWIATTTALYLATPGGALRRYDARDGLHLGAASGFAPGPAGWVKYCDNVPLVGDAPCSGSVIWGGAVQWGIMSLAGGGPNEVFVGYHGAKTAGLTCETDPDPDWCDPLVHSGKIDRVRLNADGSIRVDRFEYWENDLSLRYWHNRSPFRLLYDHTKHPGTLYSANDHGIDIAFPDRFSPYAGQGLDAWLDTYFGDHAHAVVCVPVPCNQPGSNTRAGDWRGLALDAQGRLWHAGEWTAGLIPWNANPVTWWTTWTFDAAFGDPYTGPGPGFRNEPVFQVPHEGDPVYLTAVSVCPDGRVWFATAGATSVNDTVAVWDGGAFKTYDARALGLAERGVQDLVCLPDGRIVLAGVTSGAAIYDPSSGASKPLDGLPGAHVNRLGVDTMVSPFSLLVSTDAGAAVLRTVK